MTFSLEEISVALTLVLHWQVVAAVALGVGLGILVGALPGITTVTAMAIVLPVSFFLEPLLGIPFLVGLYKGGIFGGSIPAILIATPGTGASVATTFDGPPLVREGKGRKALDMALYASVVGDAASDLFTLLMIVPISGLVLLAGPPEMAAVLLLSILITIFAVSESWIRGTIMACIGVLLATVGQDPLEFTTRLTFGFDFLASGIPLLPMLIGLFAVPEISRMIASNISVGKTRKSSAKAGPPLKLKELRDVSRTLLRSCGVGILLGIIPGIGQPAAAHTGYSLAKSASRDRAKFGHGAIEGIAAAETANNAVNGPTLIPLLTLGIPGDKVTAVLLGAFVAQGLRPGPQLMESQGAVILGLLLAMIFGNILLLVIGKAMIPLLAGAVSIRKSVLAPLVLTLALTGAYLYRSEVNDLYYLAAFGIIGIFAKRARMDLAPLVLGFILCESLEYAVAQTIQLAGTAYIEYLIYDRPGALVILLAVLSVMIWIRSRRRASKPM